MKSLNASREAQMLYEACQHLPARECFEQIAMRMESDGFDAKEIAYAIDELPDPHSTGARS